MQIGRNALTGEFMRVKDAKQNKAGAIVETIKRPPPPKSPTKPKK